jgi:ABC-type glutathione transport system ATPase component
MKWSRTRGTRPGADERVLHVDNDQPSSSSGGGSSEQRNVEPDTVNPVLALRSVWKTFDADSTSPVHALRGVDLEVAPHESVAIIGPSGSGKSTLLNILGCLDIPTRGTYLLNGTDVATLTDAGRAAVRGREIGFVFQQFHLLPHRSVLEKRRTRNHLRHHQPTPTSTQRTHRTSPRRSPPCRSRPPSRRNGSHPLRW